MQLSELERSSAAPSTAYGVFVDVVGLSPPAGLTEVGIIAIGDENGELITDVLDTLITYRLNGIRVVLEVPATVSLAADAMVRLAANIDVDVAILPPENDNEEDWQRYKEVLAQYTQAWLGQTNLVTMLYPVSGFFQYLCGAAMGFIPSQMATDPYIKARFVDNLPVRCIDEVKAHLEPIILRAFDGLPGLRTFVMNVGAGTIHKLREMAASQAR